MLPAWDQGGLGIMMVLWVAIGGAAGAAVRYAVSGWVQGLLQARPDGAFPWGTLLINVTGCALMGLLVPVLFENKLAPVLFGHSLARPAFRMAILVGFLGAYTTWSTFSYETLRFLNDGDFRHALYYAFGTNAGCFLAVWLAYHVMEWMLTSVRS
jgi:CrcB protein